MARTVRVVAFVLLCAAGAFAGAIVAGRTHAEVGPFHATVSLRPSLTGDTVVKLPPLGTLTLDTHDGPLGLTASADEIDLDAARRAAADATALEAFDDEAVGDARRAVRAVAGRGAIGALLGALAVAALRRPSRRALTVGALTAIVASGSAAGVVRASWDPDAIGEPRYTGLLTVAPQAIGAVERVQEQYAEYRSQVASLVGNVAQLYNRAATLTSFAPSADTVRVLHVSDLHLNPQAFDLIAQLVRQFTIDVVVDTGDINDWGTILEGPFVERIRSLGAPYVYVRGNHDSELTAAAVASQPNAVVLDGDSREIAGLTFWGIGDPRFTPDKSEDLDLSEERAVADRFAAEVARHVQGAGPADVVLVHDPRAAADLGGLAPLVLAGHTHRASSRDLSGDTLMLIEGSTGGAGLRTLENGEAVPLTCSVLYFEASSQSLRAFDRITVEGLGNAAAHIQRHIIPPSPTDDEPGP